jgi:mannosyl-3-phosphoglycerate phosphatase family protein
MKARMASRALMVVTDLDGTLLDDRTYAYEDARAALEALHREAGPLVLATSKTWAEVVGLARGLPMEVGAIVENGGAVIVPAHAFARPPAGACRDADLLVMELGENYDALVRHLAAIADETGVRLTGFAGLSVADIARLTGLPVAAAELASRRRHDEPFLIDDPAMVPRVAEAARRRGLEVTQGGRFLHLVGGGTDKARALRVLLAAHAKEGRHFTTVGLGDAGNDLAMLAAVDRPVIVPRPDGTLDSRLASALPVAERAPAPGPGGWNAAMLVILAGGALPTVTCRTRSAARARARASATARRRG